MSENSNVLSGSGAYVIRCQDLHKIGQTQNLRFRLAQFQIGNPFDLEVAMFVPCRLSRLNELERGLHWLVKDHRIRGEWFRLNKFDFSRMVDFSEDFADPMIVFGPILEDWKFPTK